LSSVQKIIGRTPKEGGKTDPTDGKNRRDHVKLGFCWGKKREVNPKKGELSPVTGKPRKEIYRTIPGPGLLSHIFDSSKLDVGR